MRIQSVAILAVMMASSGARADGGPLPDGGDAAEWLMSPGGLPIHGSCFHVAPIGTASLEWPSALDKDGNVLATYPTCEHQATRPGQAQSAAPELDDWVESAWVTQGNLAWGQWGTEPYNELVATWNVPNIPTNVSNQLIFIFDSLSGYNSTTKQHTIIQPVLAFGEDCVTTTDNGSKCFGGPFWWIANWIVWPDQSSWIDGYWDNGGAGINPGDTIYGSLWSNNGTSYTIEWGDNNFAAYYVDTFTITGSFGGKSGGLAGQSFVAAQPGVLEAHGVTTCDQLPAAVPGENGWAWVYFSNIVMTAPIPGWTSFSKVNANSSQWSTAVDSQTPQCSYAPEPEGNSSSDELYLWWKP